MRGGRGWPMTYEWGGGEGGRSVSHTPHYHYDWYHWWSLVSVAGDRVMRGPDQVPVTMPRPPPQSRVNLSKTSNCPLFGVLRCLATQRGVQLILGIHHNFMVNLSTNQAAARSASAYWWSKVWLERGFLCKILKSFPISCFQQGLFTHKSFKYTVWLRVSIEMR